MMKWIAEFQVKDLLTDKDVDCVEACRLAEIVIERLEATEAFIWYAKQELIDAFEGVYDQDDFNDALELMYDLAYDDRVWIK